MLGMGMRAQHMCERSVEYPRRAINLIVLICNRELWEENYSAGALPQSKRYRQKLLVMDNCFVIIEATKGIMSIW